ncbi:MULTISPECIES: hypothetical protein [unclassified Bradyrhizobium]|uniref:hypothetical protein n=1 Tax=unclassified Bradyrhizobium TaxID=2631580 RepID=UPI0024788F44|nr:MULTISPECIES: hypothetical protein [unclassified Bradyrhizobium]WGR71366.1 hypothetical protein MTX24_39715 [Bradyrhizobium sp. ISRA426]WGR76201.1 hypothetical protein MTX21_24820 [Bradyrhizobium sp. ISRA430]WGR86606.1 hypothetical protein MTX25_39405 [Bradyrhizobium sp. ISRA432]
MTGDTVLRMLRNEHPHTVLGPSMEMKLRAELTAEEAAEAVDQDHVERWPPDPAAKVVYDLNPSSVRRRASHESA